MDNNCLIAQFSPQVSLLLTYGQFSKISWSYVENVRNYPSFSDFADFQMSNTLHLFMNIAILVPNPDIQMLCICHCYVSAGDQYTPIPTSASEAHGVAILLAVF